MIGHYIESMRTEKMCGLRLIDCRVLPKFQIRPAIKGYTYLPDLSHIRVQQE